MRATLISLLAVVGFAGCQLLDIEKVPVDKGAAMQAGHAGWQTGDRSGQEGEEWSTVLGPAEGLVPVAVSAGRQGEERVAGKQLSPIRDSPECSAWESWEWPFFRHVADTTLAKLWGAWSTYWHEVYSKSLVKTVGGDYVEGWVHFEFFPDGRCVYGINGFSVSQGRKVWQPLEGRTGTYVQTPPTVNFSKPVTYQGETTYSICGEWLMFDKDTMEFTAASGWGGATRATSFRFSPPGLIWGWGAISFKRILPTSVEE